MPGQFSTHGYKEGGNPVIRWVKDTFTPSEPGPPPAPGEQAVGAFGAPAVAPEQEPVVDDESELDIQAAVRDLVGAGPVSTPTGEVRPPMAMQQLARPAAAPQAGPAQPPPVARGPMPQRRQPLPPSMAGQAGGMYYPPDFIKDLDLEHPQAGEALDRFTKYAEGPMGRFHDYSRAQQAARATQGGFQQEQALRRVEGDEQAAQAYRDLEAQEAERFKRAQLRRKRMAEDYKTQVAKYASASEAVAKREVDPERYWNSKNTASKILSAIFLAVGTAGANVSKSPNTAMQILQGSINRDIDAQKANIANERAGVARQQNVLGMMMQHYDTVEQAESAAKLFAHRQVQNKVRQIGMTTSSAVTRQKVAAFGKRLEDESVLLEKDLALKAAQVAAEAERQRMIAAQQVAAARAKAEAERTKNIAQLTGYRPLDDNERKFAIPGWGLALDASPEDITKLRERGANLVSIMANLNRMDQIMAKSGGVPTKGTDDYYELEQRFALVSNPSIKQIMGNATADEVGRAYPMFGGSPTEAITRNWKDFPKLLQNYKQEIHEQAVNHMRARGVKGELDYRPNLETGKWEWMHKGIPSAPAGSGGAEQLYDAPPPGQRE